MCHCCVDLITGNQIKLKENIKNSISEKLEWFDLETSTYHISPTHSCNRCVAVKQIYSEDKHSTSWIYIKVDLLI